MIIRWSRDATDDLVRLHRFLAPKSISAADRAVVRLAAAPRLLVDQPRMGSPVEGMEDAGVRRIIVGQYELRYELVDDAVVILRVFHTREDR